MTNEIETIQRDLEVFNVKGEQVQLRGVPAKFNKKTGVTKIDLDDIIKAEQEQLCANLGITGIQMYDLLLLYAKPSFIESGFIESRYRFNKMLFYLWKKMEAAGYPNSFTYPKFGVARAGPVPIELKDDLKRLLVNGIISIYGKKDKSKFKADATILDKKDPTTSICISLTEKGEKIAKVLWENLPIDIKEIIIKTKEELMLLSPEQVKMKVHHDYPEYRINYIQLDAE